MIQELCLFLLRGTAFYFLSINIAYGALLILSWMKIKRFRMRTRKQKKIDQLPGISFVIPAFNEESLIVETIQTYLSLPLIEKEIIVINDGSHDQTFKLLQTMFQLQKAEGLDFLYRSITKPELIVLSALHMGKSQALNFGVEHAQFDLICTMDADTIPVARGVETCLKAFASDPKLVAAGGIIQVLNSHILKNNSPAAVKNSKWLPSFQRIEYVRTFICERLGWSILGSTLLISGAFCMIKKAAIKRVGGFSHRSITEDLDLIVRLRREYQGEKHHFRILPVTTCYTQVPNTLKHLKLQRMRWQMGLVQTLSQHLSLFLHPGHGPLGLFAIPYFWLVEVLSPIMEGVAFLIIPYALYQGWVSLKLILFYLVVGLIFNLIITLIGIYLDNKYVSQDRNWSYVKSILHTLLLHIGYKQINSWWRFLALLRSFRKNNTWGDKPREEIIHQSV
jgi:cellulose synthase/poly-beta-1,6-N-acetylglucosamine synthase-like glycosyltransferase